ncbi:molecular chaperone [Shewanella sp. KX20019]|uniref:fimbrial biogenesis chaperone n=1 Tax=Shewanella sp. KX20019 TaxID=2803864 RepID=UPI00192604FA|nr:molecular chaperone [Shewanella sp. KX20019]QQX79913.1 molecular chaperone [Shewanella sp. KX20019]
MQQQKYLSEFNNMKWFIYLILMIGMLILSLCRANAGVVLNQQNRLIYDRDSIRQQFTVTNHNNYEVITKLWVSKSDFSNSPDLTSVNFIVSPPIIILKAKQTKSLHIISINNEQFPTDRESLFWINIEEQKKITKNLSKNKNAMLLSMQTMYKVLVRPSHIVKPSITAFKKQKFKLNHKGSYLTITNPTPYVITYNKISPYKNCKSTIIFSGIVKPKSSHKVKIDKEFLKCLEDKIIYSNIDDQGDHIQNIGEISKIPP